MPQVTTASEAFEQIKEGFDPETTGGATGSFLFDLSGEGGGQWGVVLEGDSVEVIEGGIEGATATINMAAEDFVAMVNGTLNAVAAFMQGKIKVQGDMALVMKLQAVLGG
jgi:putative sterol carrier protein